MLERYIKLNVIKDLGQKMVFVGGARQVGKTTLAKDILKAVLSCLWSAKSLIGS